MPVNIIVGLLSLLVAIVLYTVGTWSAFRRRGFTSRLLVVLWVGVVFDVLATVMMGMQIGGLDLTPAGLPHTVLALLAMAGMVVGIGVATYGLANGNEQLQRLVSRLLIAPWALWVAVFVYGMMTRGAARMSA